MTQSTLRFTPAQQPTVAQWLCGTIDEICDERIFFIAEQASQRIEVERGVSCLIEPQPGDLVSVMQTGSDRYFVTDILARPQAHDVPTDELHLHLPGKLTIAADQGLCLESRTRLEMAAAEMHAEIGEVHWWSRLMDLSSDRLKLSSRLARLTSKLSELIGERITVGVNHSVRTVTEAEHVRVGVFDVKADKLASLRGKCTTVTGKELVKVNASQVHIG